MTEVDAAPIEGLLDIGEDLDLDAHRRGGPLPTSRRTQDLDFIEDECGRGADRRASAHRRGPPAGVRDRRAGGARGPDRRRSREPRPPPRARRTGCSLDGDLARAAEELRLSLQGYEGVEDWTGASGIADRLVALEPDAIHHHQKRVELAFRTGERAPLLEAYLALGDALARAGATDKALAVYGRVQEHDPGNPARLGRDRGVDGPARPRRTAGAGLAPPASRPRAPPAPPPAPPSTAPPPQGAAARTRASWTWAR